MGQNHAHAALQRAWIDLSGYEPKYSGAAPAADRAEATLIALRLAIHGWHFRTQGIRTRPVIYTHPDSLGPVEKAVKVLFWKDAGTPQAPQIALLPLDKNGAVDAEKFRETVSRDRFYGRCPVMTAGVFGALGYDLVRLVERLPDINDDTLGLPDGIMTRPQIVAIFDAIAQEIIVVTPVRPGALSAADAYEAAQARIRAVAADLKRPTPALSGEGKPQADAFTTPVDRAGYAEIVAKAKAYITAGDIFQVVPSHRFRSPFPRDPFALYRSLRRTNPSPFLFYLNFGDFQLAGSSPEILVRLRDGKITIRPIAGTRKRGATPAEDAALEAELIADPKERAEHLMLLDLGRNDVGRVAMLKAPGANEPAQPSRAPRVRVTDSFFIERYSHVMHLVSNVEGDAPEGLDPVDVVMAALPAGTLSGAPKVRAMEIIDELEIEKRGIGYAGAVGYFGCDGSVDTCIVLRTALFKDQTMYVQAGGGVVADSDPDAEYDETLQKAQALRQAAVESWRFV